MTLRLSSRLSTAAGDADRVSRDHATCPRKTFQLAPDRRTRFALWNGKRPSESSTHLSFYQQSVLSIETKFLHQLSNTRSSSCKNSALGLRYGSARDLQLRTVALFLRLIPSVTVSLVVTASIRSALYMSHSSSPRLRISMLVNVVRVLID